jgi:hypothetical protein
MKIGCRVGWPDRPGRMTPLPIQVPGAHRVGWLSTTGLRPVPGGGSAPATLENHSLEVVTCESAASLPLVGPELQNRVDHRNSKTLCGAAPQTETAFTQNT